MAPGPSSTRPRRASLPDAIFAYVDYLTPNESELRILLGLPADDPRSSRELAGELRRRGVRNVVVTLGRSGALILTDELDVMVPAVPVEVVDTTGAGDAFNSGFAVALAEGRDIVDAVRFGVVCGGIACTRLGVIPGLPDRARPTRSLPKPSKPYGRTAREPQPPAQRRALACHRLHGSWRPHDRVRCGLSDPVQRLAHRSGDRARRARP